MYFSSFLKFTKIKFIFKISKENKNYNNYKNNILSLICDSHDETLEQKQPKRFEEENNKEEGNNYFKSIKKTSNIFNSIKANNNNILQQFSPSTTPSSLSRSESPANNSKNFTECDADLNIFTNDSIDHFDKNKNLLDKLIDTVNKMKEELGNFI